MLYLVLGLVLAAFGLLIAALTTANTLFAWVSVTVSVIAAGALVADWLSGRRRAREAAEEAEPDPVLTRPEQPLGDQTPPLTETRRGASRRAGRAAAREERAALREETAVREDPAALFEKRGAGRVETAAESAREAEREAPSEPVAERDPDGHESAGLDADARESVAERRSAAGREPSAPGEPSAEQESAWDFSPERERRQRLDEPAVGAGGEKPPGGTEPDSADPERAEPALAALSRTEPPADQPADRSPDRPADRSSDQAADRSPDQAADRSPEQAADRGADRPADQAPTGEADRATDRPADQTPADVVDQPAERAADQAPDRAAEKPADQAPGRAAGEDRSREERTAVLSGRRAEEARRTVVDEHGEPGEEPTDATDLLIVTDLQSQVRVVDEHPRYHLATCTFLLDKPTIPLPVAEARQLGFTPCIRCGPDATLAAQHRATR